MVAIDLLDMAVLRLTLAPSQHHSPVGQEHGRTIPLADIGVQEGLSDQGHHLVPVVAPGERRARLSDVGRKRNCERSGKNHFHANYPRVVDPATIGEAARRQCDGGHTWENSDLRADFAPVYS